MGLATAGLFCEHAQKPGSKILSKILLNKVFAYLCHPEKFGVFSLKYARMSVTGKSCWISQSSSAGIPTRRDRSLSGMVGVEPNSDQCCLTGRGWIKLHDKVLSKSQSSSAGRAADL